ncbi:MAG: hypothetical protein LBI96_01675 [Odoribacteraceae bacterium]|jgi:hypothetical protein|nr:hypothetical protein [Odoribacteraceae bacterium]
MKKIIKTRRQTTAAEEDERREIREAVDETLRGLMNGKLIGERLLLKNIRFIGFLTLLVIIFILNRNEVEKMYRARAELIQKVKEARGEATSSAVKLTEISSRAEVTRRVQQAGLDLETSKDPPVRLEK